MGIVTLSLLLSVISLLHITYGNPVDCSAKLTEITYNFTEDIIVLDLVAQSSSHDTINFDIIVKLLIFPNGNEFTIRELLIRPGIAQMYGKTSKTGEILATFKTEEGFILVGFKTKDLTNLYLGRDVRRRTRLPNWPNTITNPSAAYRQTAVKKFKEQAICFGTKYTYFYPEKEGEEPSTDMEEKLTPLSVKKSLGRWNVVVSAHSKISIALHETSAVHSAVELRKENKTYYMTMLAIFANYPVLVVVHVEEKDGYLTYTGSDKAIFRHYSQDCAVLSLETLEDSLFLSCRTDIPSSEAMSEFAQYALHLNLTYIFFRREPATSCFDIPPIVTSPDLQKLTGKWKVVGSASFISKEQSPTEITFTVEDQQVILSPDKGFQTTMEKRFDAFYDIRDGEILLKFHESPENSLLFWMGRKKEGRAALYLLSKNSCVDPIQKKKFQLFASCLSLPNILYM